MTLERHRSKLIPDIEYGGDGTLFVTSRDGTFPLRGKDGRSKGDVRDLDFGSVADRAGSFRSFDPKRDQKRMYKQRPSRYGQEVRDISGTISTGSSHSLGRRLRRSKSQRGPSSDNRGFGGGTYSEGGKYDSKRLRGGSPKMPPEFAATLERQKRARSLDLNSIRRKGVKGGSLRGGKGKNAFPVLDYNGNGKVPLVTDMPSRHRRIHDETLPYVLPLVVGPGLILLGIARICISPWHEFFCAIWSGILLMIFGIIGARHKGSYLHKCKNGSYIAFSLLSALAILASTFIVLKVLIPILKELAEGETLPQEIPETTPSFAKFSSNKPIVPINMDPQIMTWLSVAMDFSTLLLCLIGFYSMSACMIAIGNHWDASYETTSDCDHRGNPKYFNPLEQVSLGQSTTFIGIVVVLILENLDPNPLARDSVLQLYWSPVWAGVLVMIAGFFTIFFGKRADKGSLCFCSSLWQLLALAGIGAATVLLALQIVKESRDLVAGISDEDIRKQRIAAAVVEVAFVFIGIVNIIFIVGSLFRNCRQTCCDCGEAREERSDVSITKM